MRVRLALLAVCLLACSSDDAGPCAGACPGGPGSPTFGGVVSVARAGDGKLRVAWRPASDAESGPETIRYRVYASLHAGRATAKPPVLTTEPNVTSAYLTVTPADAVHYVTVRAVDPDGIEDANVVEKSARPGADATPPTFAGLERLEPLPEGGVKLGWKPATDDFTPPEGIRYAVYAGGTVVDTTKPLAVVEGVTDAVVPAAVRPGESKRFAVRAIDAAENQDANTATISHAREAEPTPPVFAGCGALTARGSRGVTVAWTAAQDDSTPPEKISYDVWLATTSRGQVLGGKPDGTVTGATSVDIGGLVPNTTYFAVCRARDEAGSRDVNTVEKSVKTSDDATRPTFAGIDSFTFDPEKRTVTLTWLPASDDRTPAAKMVYVVYERRGTVGFDFTKPRATTAPNATSIDLTDLPSNTTVAWIVRARDEALNEDPNLVEKGGTTNVSFALDVQPIFTKNCAVVGCHVTGQPAGGMPLSKGVAYESIVNVTAGQRPSDYQAVDGGPLPPNIKRIEPFSPTGSYLLRKTRVVIAPILGTQMPAPGTGNALTDEDKARLKAWVEQGAPRN